MSQITIDLTKTLAQPREASPPAGAGDAAAGDARPFADELQDAADAATNDPNSDARNDLGDAEAPRPDEFGGGRSSDEQDADAAAGGEREAATDDDSGENELEPAEAANAYATAESVAEPVVAPAAADLELDDAGTDGEAVAEVDVETDAAGVGSDSKNRQGGNGAAVESPALSTEADSEAGAETATAGESSLADGDAAFGDEGAPSDQPVEAEPSGGTPIAERDSGALPEDPTNDGPIDEQSATADVDDAGVDPAALKRADDAPRPGAATDADSPGLINEAVPADTDSEPVKAEAAPKVDPPSSQSADGPREQPASQSLTRIAAGRVEPASVADGQDAGPRVDAARFVSRVSGAFRAAQERGGEVRLRLSPPELGVLQVKLTVA
ncbi:MAG: hypothetical protein AAF596_05140, partial [Planctomycetota bacterium]